jgi:hypothetical protein
MPTARRCSIHATPTPALLAGGAHDRDDRRRAGTQLESCLADTVTVPAETIDEAEAEADGFATP